MFDRRLNNDSNIFTSLLQKIYCPNVLVCDSRHETHYPLKMAVYADCMQSSQATRSIKTGLRTADCGLRTADCGLRTADCGLRTADCGLRTADNGIKGGLDVDCGLNAAYRLLTRYKTRVKLQNTDFLPSDHGA